MTKEELEILQLEYIIYSQPQNEVYNPDPLRFSKNDYSVIPFNVPLFISSLKIS